MYEVKYKIQVPKKSELLNLCESLIRFSFSNNELLDPRPWPEGP